MHARSVTWRRQLQWHHSKALLMVKHVSEVSLIVNIVLLMKVRSRSRRGKQGISIAALKQGQKQPQSFTSQHRCSLNNLIARQCLKYYNWG
jgi:hypothetical protein